MRTRKAEQEAEGDFVYFSPSEWPQKSYRSPGLCGMMAPVSGYAAKWPAPAGHAPCLSVSATTTAEPCSEKYRCECPSPQSE